MKNIRYALFGAALFFISSVPLAFAASANPQATTTPQPFTFSCSPYVAPFIADNFYQPVESGTCTYTLPTSGQQVELALYEGVPGAAILLDSDDTYHDIFTDVQVGSEDFNPPFTQGQNYFAAEYVLGGTGNTPIDDLTNTNNYLSGSGPAPSGITINLLNWKWGVDPTVPTDTVAPAVIINTPANGSSFLQNDYVIAMASTTDDVGVATTTYLLNGSVVDPTAALPLASQPLGAATLVVSAEDAAGNVGYATSTFTILAPDLTAPTVTISNPVQDATYFDTSSILVQATATDASPIVSTSYSFNGNTIDPSLPLPLIGAPLGINTVSVSATDKYGNVGTASVTFTLNSSDVTPPTITITNPVEGHIYLNTDSVLAAATITDSSGIATSSYALNGILINPAQPLPLTLAGAGTSTLVVSATDSFGNTASSSVSFLVTAPPPPDTTAPSVTISSPTNGKKYARGDSVFIVATVADASPIANVRYLFNGKQVDPAAALVLSKAPLGYNTVSVIATDSFGNVGSSTVTFRVMPGGNTCIADVTESFDRKWIANKNIFKDAFEDCQKITGHDHDLDSYKKDDDKNHKDYSSDDRYAKAQKDIDDALNDLDSKISR